MLDFIKKLFGFKPPVGTEVAPVEATKIETPAPAVVEQVKEAPVKKAPAAKAEKPAAPKKPRAPRKPKASA